MTFFSGLCSWVKKFFKNPPKWEVLILSGIKNIIPQIEVFDTLLDPPLALEINPILDRIKTGFGALSQIETAGVDGASILASLQTNLAALEEVAGIKNSANQAKLAAIIALIKGEVDAMAASVSPAAVV